MKLDPRWFVFLNNAALLIIGRQLFGLQRTNWQIASCFVASMAVELIAERLTHKHGTMSVTDRLLSSGTSAVSTLVLLRSPTTWFYPFIAVVAILSKYLIVDERRQHVFNPTNFAIVFSVAVTPDALMIRPDQFSSEPWTMAIVLLFGGLAVLRGARWRVTAGYYCAVALVGLPLGWLIGIKPGWVVAPEINISTLIFAFLMVTDPKSSPRPPERQFLFGIGIGVVDLCLRYWQIPYPPFLALFACTALRSVWRETKAAPLPLVAE